MKDIEKIKRNCTGCYACVKKCPQNCISMITDEEGFDYPHIAEEKCIDCHLCNNICPVLNNNKQICTPKAYACINKNENIRMESSSGGIFSLLAEYVLKQGGIVYGAAFNDKYEVEHIGVTNIKTLSKLRGSKYVQSRIGNTYCEIKARLDRGQIVYFSGTPCQVAGLLNFLPKSYENLICQDFICHGVPSPKIWKQYLSILNHEHLEMPIKINFREKSSGWNLYKLSIKYANSSYECYHNQDIYMKAFLKNIDLRYSCYHCHFKGLNRLSDITLADFWGIDNVLKDMNDNKGTSLVIVNSNQGNIIFQKITTEMEYKEVDIFKAITYNSSFHESAQEPKIRKCFFGNINKNNFKQYLTKITQEKFYIKIKSKIYNILNKIKRNLLNHENKSA